jgi:hypothetical protein
MPDGRVDVGILRQPGEGRGFRQRQFGQVLAKIKLGGRFESEVAVAELHLVRVHGEDLRLGEVALDLDGE